MHVQVVDKKLKSTVLLGLLYSAWTLVLGLHKATFFGLVMLGAYLIGNIMIPKFVKSDRKQFIVLWVYSFLIGFPIFYLTNQVFPETKNVGETVQQTTTSPYQTVTNKMMAVSVEEFHSILSTNKQVVLYMGRESCPFCMEFVSKMQTLTVDSVYYIDTENKTMLCLTLHIQII